MVKNYKRQKNVDVKCKVEIFLPNLQYPIEFCTLNNVFVYFKKEIVIYKLFHRNKQ